MTKLEDPFDRLDEPKVKWAIWWPYTLLALSFFSSVLLLDRATDIYQAIGVFALFAASILGVQYLANNVYN